MKLNELNYTVANKATTGEGTSGTIGELMDLPLVIFDEVVGYLEIKGVEVVKDRGKYALELTTHEV